jgi:hypothetical protein
MPPIATWKVSVWFKVPPWKVKIGSPNPVRVPLES